MSTAPNRSMSPRDLRAAKDTLQFCGDWRDAMTDVWNAIEHEDDPTTAKSDRLTIPGRINPSVLEFLHIVTSTLCEAASVRYRWFDSRPFWEIFVLVKSWDRTDRNKMDLWTLHRSIEPKITRLQEAAMMDLGMLPLSGAAALHEIEWSQERAGKKRAKRPNDERDEWVYDQYVNHPKKKLDTIIHEAKKTKGWIIGSRQHLLKCLDAYCKAHRMSTIRRNDSRTKPK